MTRKLSIVLILCLYLLTFIAPVLVIAEEPVIPGPSEGPRIIIARDRAMQVFNAGETVNLSIPVENISSTSAKNVTVSIQAGDINSFPFEMDKMSLSKYSNYLSGASLYSFKLIVPTNVKPAIYPINVVVNYSSDYGFSGSESATIYVKVINEQKQPELKLMGVEFEGDSLEAGKPALIKLRIKNDGDLPIKDLELKMSGFSTNGISLDNWPDTQYIKSLNEKEFRMVEFKLLLHSKIETGTYALDLGMKYQDEHNKEYKHDVKVYLAVQGDEEEEEDKLIPRIIIDNYSISGAYAMAGETFALNISLLNTSENTVVKNIKVSLSSDEQVFSPVGMSNSFYITEIEPQARNEKVISLKPKIDAENKTYNISADIEYQDNAGNKYIEKEIISIPVNQQMGLVISDIELPLEAYSGVPMAVSVDFYNTGRIVVRNLLVTAEGNFEIQDGTMFIGNLEPGKDNYYDVTIIPHEAGLLEGKIIFEYEDAVNQKYKREKSFELNVISQEPFPMDDFEHPITDNEENMYKKWLIPAGAIFLVLIIAVMAFRKYRKRKQDDDLDEE